MLSYFTAIEKQEDCEDWLVAQLQSVTGMQLVTLNPAELIGNYNLPLAGVFPDEMELDGDYDRTNISIVLKQKGASIRDILPLVKLVVPKLQDFTMGRNCTKARVRRIEYDIEADTKGQASIKAIWCRIEMEVLL